MKISYPVQIQEDPSNGYTVFFCDLKEAFTEGDTLEEALLNSQEVLDLTIEARMDEGMLIPLPSKIIDATYIAVSPRTQIKLNQLQNHDK